MIGLNNYYTPLTAGEGKRKKKKKEREKHWKS